MTNSNTRHANKSWTHLAIRDFFVLLQFLLVRWLIVLGAWNSVVAPIAGFPEITLLMAAAVVSGWALGLALFGDA